MKNQNIYIVVASRVSKSEVSVYCQGAYLDALSAIERVQWLENVEACENSDYFYSVKEVPMGDVSGELLYKSQTEHYFV